jgi:copper chaperone CopZ
MKKFLLITALLAALVNPALAADSAPCADKVSIKVNGLVCDFCSRAVTKVFHQHAEVNDVNVNLDNGMVTVAMKPLKSMDNATITKLVTDAGYSVVKIDHSCGRQQAAGVSHG